MSRNNFLFLLMVMNSWLAFGQTTDTIRTKELLLISVEGTVVRNAVTRLEPIVGTYIFSGKKNEVIFLNHMDANITEKTGRQIFAKVPGVFVYDMEGGNQMNIATRGLDPHRGWELNLRLDGVLTNSDMYAYPASHYSIPMESVESIELVRGTGSLQYGAQFGGMLNYVSKQGDTSKPIGFETFNTMGSYNLLSTYNAIGGKIGKLKYYGYFSKRSRDGYRKNEHTDYDAERISLCYEPIHQLSIRVDYARSNYTYQLPGPLTDSMFVADPTQATRARNYFNPTIHIPSLTVKWEVSKNTKIQFVSSAVKGDRNSVLFDKVANIADTINASILQYSNRQVDIDHFNSFTQELRLLQNYRLGEHRSTLVAGVQLMNNILHRTQLGKGTTGADFNISVVDSIWGRNIKFATNNIAFFAENNFVILNNFSINLGMRIETGESKMSGTIVYYPDNQIPNSIVHHFTLLGASYSYKPNQFIELYGGISQAYRPMIFKDIVPSSIFEKVDGNIKDAFGYNAEIGFRGKYLFLSWDITGFLLRENNRFGTMSMKDENGVFYTYRTNIGNSLTKGLEFFVQGNWKLYKKSQLTLFTSTSLMDGRYTSGNIKSGNKNVDIKDNKIESVPNIISRNGITIQYSKLSLTGQFSYTSESFADALNTVNPNETGTVGLVPAYGILDLNASYKVSKNVELKASLSNLTDLHYFTKRPLFYPGPGIWPSDGRNGSISVIVKI